MADGKPSEGSGIKVGTIVGGTILSAVLVAAWHWKDQIAGLWASADKPAPAAPGSGLDPGSAAAPTPTAASPTNAAAPGASPPSGTPPTTRISRTLRYPPGSTVVTEIGPPSKQMAESWIVGPDGVTLTMTGPAVAMTQALMAQRDASRKSATPIAGAGPAPGTQFRSMKLTPGGAPPPPPTSSAPAPGSAGTLGGLLPGGMPTTPAGALAAGQKLLGPAGGALGGLLGGGQGGSASPLSGLLGGDPGGGPAAGGAAVPDAPSVGGDSTGGSD